MNSVKTQSVTPDPPRQTSNSSTVRFVLNLTNAEAHQVFVAGAFNDWNPGTTPMTYVAHGCWVKELPLPPGRYEYQFVVDGRWMHDRMAKEAVDNPFGGLNSVIVVAQPKKRAPKEAGKGKELEFAHQ